MSKKSQRGNMQKGALAPPAHKNTVWYEAEIQRLNAEITRLVREGNLTILERDSVIRRLEREMTEDKIARDLESDLIYELIHIDASAAYLTEDQDLIEALPLHTEALKDKYNKLREGLAQLGYDISDAMPDRSEHVNERLGAIEKAISDDKLQSAQGCQELREIAAKSDARLPQIREQLTRIRRERQEQAEQEAKEAKRKDSETHENKQTRQVQARIRHCMLRLHHTPRFNKYKKPLQAMIGYIYNQLSPLATTKHLSDEDRAVHTYLCPYFDDYGTARPTLKDIASKIWNDETLDEYEGDILSVHVRSDKLSVHVTKNER